MQYISVKGKRKAVNSISIEDTVIVCEGKILKIARVNDESWLDNTPISNPEEFLSRLSAAGGKVDLFTFSQRIPETQPKYAFYHEWDNVAAVPIQNYEVWLNKQISRKSRQAIAKSQREMIVVRRVVFDDELVAGISSIYNETPIRQGKPFWHYGKNIEIVKRDNETFLDRSDFIAAFYENEIVGFIKIVYCSGYAALMQILSKVKYRNKNPTNALLAKAIEVCAEKKKPYLTYGNYVYGDKDESSLIDFKRHNGFEKIDLPKYYIPLTVKGKMAIACNLHHGIKGIVPKPIKKTLTALYKRYHIWKNGTKS
jgi:hypothetical protein